MEVTFHAIPTVEELQDLRQWVMRQASQAGGKVEILVSIAPGGLGMLRPDARQYIADHWRSLRDVTTAVAVIIEGDSVGATLTRGFVRTLGTMLGRAWTVHTDRDGALRRLAAARSARA